MRVISAQTRVVRLYTSDHKYKNNSSEIEFPKKQVIFQELSKSLQ